MVRARAWGPEKVPGVSQPTHGGGWGSGLGSGGPPDAAEKGAVTQRRLECWDRREGLLGYRQGVGSG